MSTVRRVLATFHILAVYPFVLAADLVRHVSPRVSLRRALHATWRDRD